MEKAKAQEADVLRKRLENHKRNLPQLTAEQQQVFRLEIERIQNQLAEIEKKESDKDKASAAEQTEVTRIRREMFGLKLHGDD